MGSQEFFGGCGKKDVKDEKDEKDIKDIKDSKDFEGSEDDRLIVLCVL
jgi:hypothetical protein